MAFRNTALETQLAAHVAELDRTTRELADSRSRIIEADDAARRTLEAAISRDVLPHLASVPERLVSAREPRARVARERARPARGRHQQRARGAARADPRRLPDAARPRRARAGAALAPGPQRRCA